MLAAATLAVLTVLQAGVAQAGSADERSQRVLERTLARHRALGALDTSAAQAVQQLDRSLARHRALGAIAAPLAGAAPPAARTDPTAPSPNVDVPATLLVGLVGGLLGGIAVVVGWIATTRRRRPRPAAGT
jgi:hypothetical protein